MTTIQNRSQRSGWTGLAKGVCALAAGLLSMALSSGANANVELQNSIAKIETSIGANGEVQRRMVKADSVVPGDELQYRVTFTNAGNQPVDAGTIVITDLIPEHTEYVPGTAFGSGTEIEFSLNGETFGPSEALLEQGAELDAPVTPADFAAIRWQFGPALQPGESGYVSFNVRLK